MFLVGGVDARLPFRDLVFVDEEPGRGFECGFGFGLSAFFPGSVGRSSVTFGCDLLFGGVLSFGLGPPFCFACKGFHVGNEGLSRLLKGVRVGGEEVLRLVLVRVRPGERLAGPVGCCYQRLLEGS